MTNKKKLRKVAFVIGLSFQVDEGIGSIKKRRERKKKTEHTIISHITRNSERQNIHVMLSYAIKTYVKTKKSYVVV